MDFKAKSDDLSEFNDGADDLTTEPDPPDTSEIITYSSETRIYSLRPAGDILQSDVCEMLKGDRLQLFITVWRMWDVKGRQTTVVLCTALLHDSQFHLIQEINFGSTIVCVDNTAALADYGSCYLEWFFTWDCEACHCQGLFSSNVCSTQNCLAHIHHCARKKLSEMMIKQSNGPQFIAHRDFTMG